MKRTTDDLQSKPEYDIISNRAENDFGLGGCPGYV